MSPKAPPQLTQTLVDWSSIDSVLLDMDGTLIDLHFDNTLWNSHLPARYAQANSISESSARELLFEQMRTSARTIEFYCLDYWAEFTDLDIMQLHADLAHLLRFRDGTESFLAWLKNQSSRTLMATNAHRASVAFKAQHLELLKYFDGVVSSHDYQQVKESQEFWHQLILAEQIDPDRAVFIDDNEAVLDAASEFGIRDVICVASPDSKRKPRTSSSYPLIDALSDLQAPFQPSSVTHSAPG